ncbi:MAG: LptF/LptG family permease [Planctomycetota bacterium]|jgi:lipopolysaccharide export LptBFGC system permease protein LptF
MAQLDRYLLREVLVSFLLTTTILVVVIAFGAAVKPLAGDQLLSAGQVVKYIGLAIIPMLEFALPFGAGFAATLTLHQMTADNEILAMSVSGVSYKRIFAPVAALGLVLGVCMVLLTQWWVPRFWGLLHATIATDVTRIFQATIARGDPFELGSMQIYAEDLAVQENPEDTDADTRMILAHGVAADLDDQGRVVTDVTFTQAVVDIYRRPEGLVLKLAMVNAVMFNSQTGQLVRADRFVRQRGIPIPNALQDDPVTMTQAKLLALRENPDSYSFVIRARRELANELRDTVIARDIDRRLRAGESVSVVMGGPTPRQYRIRAGEFTNGVFHTNVEIEEWAEGRAVRRFRPARALFPSAEAWVGVERAFDLRLEECEVVDLVTGRQPNVRSVVSFPGVTVPEVDDPTLLDRSSADLIAMVDDTTNVTSTLTSRRTVLEDNIRDLGFQVTARLHRRYALCVTAPLLLLLGAVLAVWLKRSLPLTIYMWAFLPAVANLILISGGDQMIQDRNRIGLLVVWAGNLTLLVLLLFAGRRVARH